MFLFRRISVMEVYIQIQREVLYLMQAQSYIYFIKLIC